MFKKGFYFPTYKTAVWKLGFFKPASDGQLFFKKRHKTIQRRRLAEILNDCFRKKWLQKNPVLLSWARF
jgi:hypothetical protein